LLCNPLRERAVAHFEGSMTKVVEQSPSLHKYSEVLVVHLSEFLEPIHLLLSAHGLKRVYLTSKVGSMFPEQMIRKGSDPHPLSHQHLALYVPVKSNGGKVAWDEILPVSSRIQLANVSSQVSLQVYQRLAIGSVLFG
jgi:hypothetical protein